MKLLKNFQASRTFDLPSIWIFLGLIFLWLATAMLFTAASRKSLLLALRYSKALRFVPVPIPESKRADFHWGIGYGARALFRRDKNRALHFLNPLTPEEREEAMFGLLYYEAQHKTGSETAM